MSVKTIEVTIDGKQYTAVLKEADENKDVQQPLVEEPDTESVPEPVSAPTPLSVSPPPLEESSDSEQFLSLRPAPAGPKKPKLRRIAVQTDSQGNRVYTYIKTYYSKDRNGQETEKQTVIKRKYKPTSTKPEREKVSYDIVREMLERGDTEYEIYASIADQRNIKPYAKSTFTQILKTSRALISQ